VHDDDDGPQLEDEGPILCMKVSYGHKHKFFHKFGGVCRTSNLECVGWKLWKQECNVYGRWFIKFETKYEQRFRPCQCKW